MDEESKCFLPLSFIIIFSFGVEHNIRIFGVLFYLFVLAYLLFHRSIRA